MRNRQMGHQRRRAMRIVNDGGPAQASQEADGILTG